MPQSFQSLLVLTFSFRESSTATIISKKLATESILQSCLLVSWLHTSNSPVDISHQFTNSLKHQQLPLSLYQYVSVKTIQKSLKLKTLDSTLIFLSLATHILHQSPLSFPFLPPKPKPHLPRLPVFSRVCTPPLFLSLASSPAVYTHIHTMVSDGFQKIFFKLSLPLFHFIVEKLSMLLRMSQLGFQSALRCVHQLSNFILHYYNTKASHSQVPNIFALSPMSGATVSPTSSHALSFPFYQSKILAILGMLYSQYHDRHTGQPPKFPKYIMLFCTSAPILMNLQLPERFFLLLVLLEKSSVCPKV